jgi:hypothetical protein
MWDHKIDMKEGFEPKSFKNYNLTPEEQKELDKFLNKKDTFNHLSRPKHHLSSLSRRRMEKFDHVKTIGT